VGLAGRRAGAEAVRLRGRSVCGWPAPRDRHRSSHGLRRPFRRARSGRVRRTIAATGPLPDGPNRGRLVGHARPPGLDRSARRDSGPRGRRRRHDRPERRARGDGAVCLSGHPAHGGPQRLRRPTDPSASQAGVGAGATGPADVTGAGSGSASGGASAVRRARPAAPACGRGESTCPATIRGDTGARRAWACEADVDAAVPLSAAHHARRSPSEREPFVRGARALDLPRRTGHEGRSRRRLGDVEAHGVDAACDAGRGSAAGSLEADAADPARRGRLRTRGARRRRSASPAAGRPASVRPTAPP
jgi:hypothetical protein